MARFCGKCGTELQEQARFCRKCGFRMDMLEAKTTPERDELRTEIMPSAENSAPPSPKPNPRRQTVAIPAEDLRPIQPQKREPAKPPQPTQTPAKPPIQPPVFARPTNIEPIKFTEPSPPPLSATELLPVEIAQERAPRKSIPQPEFRPEAPRRAAAAVAPANVNRKWLPLVIPAVLLAAVCAAFFIFNSRQSSAETTEVIQAPAIAVATPTPEATQEPIPSPTPDPDSSTNAIAAARKTPTPKAAASPTPKSTPQETVANAAPTPLVTARTEPQPTPKILAVEPARRLTADDHMRQGIANLNSGGFTEALSEFERVRLLAPGNTDVYYLIGQANHRMGRIDQALAAYKQCTSGVYAGVAQNHVLLLEKKKKEKYKE